MKQQEIIEKVLREKLEGAEMEPPAAMFERIAAQIDRPVQVAWYRRPALYRVAAAFTLFAVSAGLLFNNWPELEEGTRMSPGLASFDSLQQERVDDRLESLKFAATQASEDAARIARNKNIQPVQPASPSVRLAFETNKQIEVQPETQQVEMLQAMEMRPVSGIRTAGVKWQPLQKKEASPIEYGYASADEEGLLPALSKSYSLLSNGGLFELAKERFDDFKTKEHYVSFHLGSFEIGQTIQLSRQENTETIENK